MGSVESSMLLVYRGDGSLAFVSTNSAVEEIVGFLKFDVKGVQKSVLVNLKPLAETRPDDCEEIDLVLKLNPVAFNTKYELADFSFSVPENPVLIQKLLAIAEKRIISNCRRQMPQCL